MLAKLLKYEIKASARTLIPLYIGTLIVALVCSIQIMLSINSSNGNFAMAVGSFQANNTLTGILFLLFFGLCVAITVLTIMTVIQRFNHSLIGDEGYLMFTLPVTHTQLLSSQLIAAMLWSIIGIFIMFLSSIIISFSGIMLGWDELNLNTINWNQIADIIQTAIQPMLISVIYGFFSLASAILLVYLSIMIAQTEKLNNHRVAVAVILFFVIGWMFSGAESILFLEIRNIAAPDSFHISDDFMWAYNMAMACQIAFEAVKCVICFIGTKWLMQNKLNL